MELNMIYSNIRKTGFLFFLFFLLSACGGGGSGSGSGGGAGNLSPVASAGDDQYHNYSEGMVIELDGSGSSDPKGGELTYSWEIISGPEGAGIIEPSVDPSIAEFLVFSSGIYEVQLTVTDDSGSSDTDIVAISINAIPVAVVTGDAYSVVNNEVIFEGIDSFDEDADALTYSWRIVSIPEFSTAVVSAEDTPAISILPDVEGIYSVELVVNDGKSDSDPSQITLEVHRKIENLSYRPVDAEYNVSTNEIVMVSESPNQLHIYDPILNKNIAVDLPLSPSSVSVGPNGQFAAVGHDGWVSYVDLSSTSLIKSIPVSADVLDVVLAGNGYIYAFPRIDQWETIRSLNIDTGVETTNSGRSIRAGTLAKLHPTMEVIYGADNGLSPSDIERYDISKGTAEYSYDSPYHGDYSMCGNLWISKDGLRIFTRCGNVFRSSQSESNDMVYNGSLSDVVNIQELDHSVAADEVALIPGVSYWGDDKEDTKIKRYDYDFLVHKDDLTIPKFVMNGNAYDGRGRFVFYHSDGERLFVVVQADETSGMLNDYGVTIY
ncbi:PKD domain-containing protein [Microbulbifer sp. JMSA003]|uniref:PKD domain-containing protein n=1 Tax=Microbulbifer sp. JMSA003 TaxID=3243369 RepID=UPI00403A477E